MLMLKPIFSRKSALDLDQNAKLEQLQGSLNETIAELRAELAVANVSDDQFLKMTFGTQLPSLAPKAETIEHFVPKGAGLPKPSFVGELVQYINNKDEIAKRLRVFNQSSNKTSTSPKLFEDQTQERTLEARLVQLALGKAVQVLKNRENKQHVLQEQSPNEKPKETAINNTQQQAIKIIHQKESQPLPETLAQPTSVDETVKNILEQTQYDRSIVSASLDNDNDQQIKPWTHIPTIPQTSDRQPNKRLQLTGKHLYHEKHDSMSSSHRDDIITGHRFRDNQPNQDLIHRLDEALATGSATQQLLNVSGHKLVMLSTSSQEGAPTQAEVRVTPNKDIKLDLSSSAQKQKANRSVVNVKQFVMGAGFKNLRSMAEALGINGQPEEKKRTQDILAEIAQQTLDADLETTNAKEVSKTSIQPSGDISKGVGTSSLSELTFPPDNKGSKTTALMDQATNQKASKLKPISIQFQQDETMADQIKVSIKRKTLPHKVQKVDLSKILDEKYLELQNSIISSTAKPIHPSKDKAGIKSPRSPNQDGNFDVNVAIETLKRIYETASEYNSTSQFEGTGLFKPKLKHLGKSAAGKKEKSKINVVESILNPTSLLPIDPDDLKNSKEAKLLFNSIQTQDNFNSVTSELLPTPLDHNDVKVASDTLTAHLNSPLQVTSPMPTTLKHHGLQNHISQPKRSFASQNLHGNRTNVASFASSPRHVEATQIYRQAKELLQFEYQFPLSTRNMADNLFNNQLNSSNNIKSPKFSSIKPVLIENDDVQRAQHSSLSATKYIEGRRFSHNAVKGFPGKPTGGGGYKLAVVSPKQNRVGKHADEMLDSMYGLLIQTQPLANRRNTRMVEDSKIKEAIQQRGQQQSNVDTILRDQSEDILNRDFPTQNLSQKPMDSPELQQNAVPNKIRQVQFVNQDQQMRMRSLQTSNRYSEYQMLQLLKTTRTVPESRQISDDTHVTQNGQLWCHPATQLMRRNSVGSPQPSSLDFSPSRSDPDSPKRPMVNMNNVPSRFSKKNDEQVPTNIFKQDNSDIEESLNATSKTGRFLKAKLASTKAVIDQANREIIQPSRQSESQKAVHQEVVIPQKIDDKSLYPMSTKYIDSNCASNKYDKNNSAEEKSVHQDAQLLLTLLDTLASKNNFAQPEYIDTRNYLDFIVNAQTQATIEKPQLGQQGYQRQMRQRDRRFEYSHVAGENARARILSISPRNNQPDIGISATSVNLRDKNVKTLKKQNKQHFQKRQLKILRHPGSKPNSYNSLDLEMEI